LVIPRFPAPCAPLARSSQNPVLLGGPSTIERNQVAKNGSRIVCGAAVLAFALSDVSSAQTVGLGYQVAQTDLAEIPELYGAGLRIPLNRTIAVRYDYLRASPSYLHTIFAGLRIPLIERGAFTMAIVPEAGIVHGRIFAEVTCADCIPIHGTDAKGTKPGAGAGLELSATALGRSQLGGWVALRYRAMVPSGSPKTDRYDPFLELDRIGSIEFGLTYAF
jgi:hypothetical protein